MKAKDLIKLMEQGDKKKYEVQVKDTRGNEMKAEVCNPNDLFGDEEGVPFWKSTYLIQLSFSNYIVNADHEQSAIDELIDYLIEYAPGYILSDEEAEEAEEDGSIEDYTQGGNAGNYINEPMQMRKINPHKEIADWSSKHQEYQKDLKSELGR
jgi:hypothetical protein